MWSSDVLGLATAGVVLSACTFAPPEDISDDWEPLNADWELVWSDEFDGPAGTSPNPAYWTMEVGGHGWGNGELQYHTDRPENVSQNGEGQLVIEAREEAYSGLDFTSARIKTDGLVEQMYGRIEARMKLPQGKGLWPAFWMLGSSVHDVGWPRCGEVDIMEMAGSQPSSIGSALHGPGYAGSNPLNQGYELASGSFNDDFHVFAFEWGEQGMRWLVDDEVFHMRSRAAMEAMNRPWVYDQAFFILLNLSVGGWYDGPPNENTRFPQQLIVDYVRMSKPKTPG